MQQTTFKLIDVGKMFHKQMTLEVFNSFFCWSKEWLHIPEHKKK
jgi:hypothetical protein